MLALVAEAMFILIELKEGIDLVIQFGCGSGRRKYGQGERPAQGRRHQAAPDRKE
jgi:coenzyme F420-reducing hydrogenase delta subunit